MAVRRRKQTDLEAAEMLLGRYLNAWGNSKFPPLFCDQASERRWKEQECELRKKILTALKRGLKKKESVRGG